MIYPIHHLPDKVPVGVQTEQGVEDIGFDLKHWLAVFPDMVFTVWATRPGEQEAYPVNEQMLIGSVLYWHPDGYDTAIAGEGKVEIVGVGENRRKLSGFVPTAIDATSMGATKEPGENTVPWYEKIINAAIEIMTDVDVGAGGLFLVDVKVDGGHRYLADRTQAEIIAAVDAGKTCILHDTTNALYLYAGMEEEPTTREQCPTFYGEIVVSEKNGTAQRKCYVRADGYVSSSGVFAKTPSPYSLIIGDHSYNGSEEVVVSIPDVPDVLVVKRSASDYNKADHTPAEIREAFASGKACVFVGNDATYIYYGEAKDHTDASKTVITFFSPLNSLNSGGSAGRFAQIQEDGDVFEHEIASVKAVNPRKLTIGGIDYDGSQTKVVLPVPADKTAASYLRWNGTSYVSATIAQLKADLGLT